MSKSLGYGNRDNDSNMFLAQVMSPFGVAGEAYPNSDMIHTTTKEVISTSDITVKASGRIMILSRPMVPGVKDQLYFDDGSGFLRFVKQLDQDIELEQYFNLARVVSAALRVKSATVAVGVATISGSITGAALNQRVIAAILTPSTLLAFAPGAKMKEGPITAANGVIVLQPGVSPEFVLPRNITDVEMNSMEPSRPQEVLGKSVLAHIPNVAAGWALTGPSGNSLTLFNSAAGSSSGFLKPFDSAGNITVKFNANISMTNPSRTSLRLVINRLNADPVTWATTDSNMSITREVDRGESAASPQGIGAEFDFFLPYDFVDFQLIAEFTSTTVATISSPVMRWEFKDIQSPLYMQTSIVFVDQVTVDQSILVTRVAHVEAKPDSTNLKILNTSLHATRPYDLQMAKMAFANNMHIRYVYNCNQWERMLLDLPSIVHDSHCHEYAADWGKIWQTIKKIGKAATPILSKVAGGVANAFAPGSGAMVSQGLGAVGGAVFSADYSADYAADYAASGMSKLRGTKKLGRLYAANTASKVLRQAEETGDTPTTDDFVLVENPDIQLELDELDFDLDDNCFSVPAKYIPYGDYAMDSDSSLLHEVEGGLEFGRDLKQSAKELGPDPSGPPEITTLKSVPGSLTVPDARLRAMPGDDALKRATKGFAVFPVLRSDEESGEVQVILKNLCVSSGPLAVAMGHSYRRLKMEGDNRLTVYLDSRFDDFNGDMFELLHTVWAPMSIYITMLAGGHKSTVEVEGHSWHAAALAACMGIGNSRTAFTGSVMTPPGGVLLKARGCLWKGRVLIGLNIPEAEVPDSVLQEKSIATNILEFYGLAPGQIWNGLFLREPAIGSMAAAALLLKSSKMHNVRDEEKGKAKAGVQPIRSKVHARGTTPAQIATAARAQRGQVESKKNATKFFNKHRLAIQMLATTHGTQPTTLKSFLAKRSNHEKYGRFKKELERITADSK